MDFARNLEQVQERMGQACSRAGRETGSVSLLAVGKGHPPAAVEALAALQQTLFGESRVQEAKAKIPQCPSRLRWHLVGHLQSNKCRDATQLFEMIHSVDSLNLARELAKAAEKASRRVAILLEVNVAGEATKFGFKPNDLLESLGALGALRAVEVSGLMTIAPWSKDPEKVRPVFAALRQLKEKCEEAMETPLQHLSMGMSHDFEIAIEEGATIVRVGTDLFGPRSGAVRAVD